jgi:DNA-binding response OmpR family regulator
MIDETSISVLVIDEEPPVLALISEMLAENGIRALLARTADEALSIARRDYVPIDLILADRQLPDAVGTEIVARIRAYRPHVRALYMSSFVDAGVIRIDLPGKDDGDIWRPRSLVETIRRSVSRSASDSVS